MLAILPLHLFHHYATNLQVRMAADVRCCFVLTPAASFGNIRNIMLSPLPRVYEEGHNGQAVPSEPEPTMVGGDVQVERLTTASAETKKRLDVEVIQPIKQWMVAYRTIAVSKLWTHA
jgi:hypothetical protein